MSWLRGRSMEGEDGLSQHLGDSVELPPALARRLSHSAAHNTSHGVASGITRPRLVTKPGAGYVWHGSFYFIQ